MLAIAEPNPYIGPDRGEAGSTTSYSSRHGPVRRQSSAPAWRREGAPAGVRQSVRLGAQPRKINRLRLTFAHTAMSRVSTTANLNTRLTQLSLDPLRTGGAVLTDFGPSRRARPLGLCGSTGVNMNDRHAATTISPESMPHCRALDHRARLTTRGRQPSTRPPTARCRSEPSTVLVRAGRCTSRLPPPPPFCAKKRPGACRKRFSSALVLKCLCESKPRTTVTNAPSSKADLQECGSRSDGPRHRDPPRRAATANSSSAIHGRIAASTGANPLAS